MQREEGQGEGKEPPVPVMVPERYSWLKFLAHMGWNDEAVLGRQSVGHVKASYQVYQLECEYGAL